MKILPQTSHCTKTSAAEDATEVDDKGSCLLAEEVKEVTVRDEHKPVVRGGSALIGSRTLLPRLQRGDLWKTVRLCNYSFDAYINLT